MSDEAESQEPTMEEILASIRRIISEDDEGEEAASSEDAPVEVEAAPEPVDEVEAEEEVMELTDMIVEEPADEPEAEPVAEPEPEAKPEVEAEEVMELEAAPEPAIEEVVENDIDFGEPMPMAEPEPEADVVQVEEDGALISGATEVATAAAFGELASSMITSSGESRTLEGLVGDMLRPMLKDWMDKNLPDLVEQMVREEIERVARRGR